MEFLLVLNLIITIVLLIVTLNQKGWITSRMYVLQQHIELLSNELKKYTRGSEVKKEPVPTPQPQERVVPPAVDKPREEKVEPPPVQEPIKSPEPIKPPDVIKVPEVIPSNKPQPTVFNPQDLPKKQVVQAPVRPVKPAKPGFFERNPDLEKFIGENLANKIGIAILVLGIGYFVKYAIDQEWIGEIGRVFIGILCGGILLGLAHRLRQKFAAFSSVLVGGGIAVLYFTIAIAFHEYQIFSQTAAFIIMVVITGFTIVLSLSYNRVELAVLAILGGFGSPFMVSTGEGNYVVLFTYVLILNIGMLVLAYYKKWNIINLIAYIFTIILFGSWLSVKFDGANLGMIRGAMLFATLFYLVFFSMNLVNNLKVGRKFAALEISMLLSTTFLYYAAGMVILNNPYGEPLKGLFTAGVGIFNFGFAYSLYKRANVDRNLVFLLIGLVLTFMSLAAPVQLQGNYITMFWAAEAVLLLWLSQQSGIKLMKLASIVVMGLMVISLIMDWGQLYPQYYDDNESTMRIIFNKAYITGIFAIASIASTIFLLRRETGEFKGNAELYKIILSIGGVIILYTSQYLELQYHVVRGVEDYAAQNIIIGTYNMASLLGLTLAGKKLPLPENIKEGFAGWGVFGILTYLFFYHQQIVDARNFYIGGESITGFAFHYALVTLLLCLAVVSLSKFRKLTDFNEKTFNLYSWFFVFFFVFIASAELDHSVVLATGVSMDGLHNVITQNQKIGYPILWGLTSFLLIFIGLRMKRKHLRIISLSLMAITLLKLFILDIRGISHLGKIAAFVSLGVLLLIVSFMYQKLKQILLDDEPAKEDVKSE